MVSSFEQIRVLGPAECSAGPDYFKNWEHRICSSGSNGVRRLPLDDRRLSSDLTRFMRMLRSRRPSTMRVLSIATNYTQEVVHGREKKDSQPELEAGVEIFDF